MTIKISLIDLSQVNQFIAGVKGPALLKCISCGVEEIRETKYFCGFGCRVCGCFKVSFEHPVPSEKMK